MARIALALEAHWVNLGPPLDNISIIAQALLNDTTPVIDAIIAFER